tara:strand:- start:3610 stop:4437 length:828 start_codon:yes stop_codon:yes gene_type:complete
MNNKEIIKDLTHISLELRKSIVKTSHTAKIPHLGSCLSCLEILVCLYWNHLKIDPNNSNDPGRDKFILSKGHAAPALFQVLAHKGFFPTELLNEFGKSGSLFHEHPPKPGYIPGVEAATGSLGHGLPMALGMALGNQIKNIKSFTYSLLSDGECNEGSIWEAALLAGSLKIDSLIAIVDYNKWQATGRSKEIMRLEPLAKKWEDFGWDTQEIDGHNFEEIIKSLDKAKRNSGKPSIIIAHTIKGKGISFMEDDNNWHYRTPNLEELTAALSELNQ